MRSLAPALALGAALLLAAACPKKNNGGGDGGTDGGGGTDVPFEVFLESHGSPTWKPVGFQFFSAPMGDQAGGFIELGETLETLVAGGQHALDLDYEVIVPAAEHAPPYDDEWSGVVSEAGFKHTGGFIETEFDQPAGIYLLMNLVPTEGAPTGDTPSGTGLPLIANDTFPITIEGTISRAGQVVDGNVDGQFPAPSSFVPPLGPDGLSHVPIWMVEQTSFFTVQVDTPGIYEWQIQLLDSQGMGWTASIPFTVSPEVIVDADGGVVDGGGSVTKSCREGGLCDPDRYSDADQGPYPTAAYPNMFLRDAFGAFRASNRNGEIIHAAGKANDQNIDFWLMSRASDSEPLVNVFGTGGLSVGKLYQFVDAAGAPLGTPVLELNPDSGNYSLLVQVVEVEAVEGYTPDGIKSATTLRFARRDPATGFVVRGTNEVRALWPVDPTVDLQDGPVPGSPRRLTVWADKRSVDVFEAPGTGEGDTLALVPSTDPDNEPPTVLVGKMWQFTGAGGAPCGGANVFSHRLAATGYSPLVLVHATSAPDCTAVPANAADVEAGISAGTYTVSGTFHALLPQVP
ncbi:MAG: hypothetical protein P1V51_13085 [Deltaproteobacteria bacterium]|nr:hypothetical protein [Deltaproteobacteria bacterium]